MQKWAKRFLKLDWRRNQKKSSTEFRPSRNRMRLWPGSVIRLRGTFRRSFVAILSTPCGERLEGTLSSDWLAALLELFPKQKAGWVDSRRPESSETLTTITSDFWPALS